MVKRRKSVEGVMRENVPPSLATAQAIASPQAASDLTQPDQSRASDEGTTLKMYSGKLPFRTKPETHGRIAQAAQQAGLSINAWLERAAEEKLQRDQVTKTDLSLASLQKTLGSNSSIIFDLVDEFRPQLKSQKTSTMFELIEAIERLLIGWDCISTHLNPHKVRTITDLMNVIQPYLNDASPDRTCDFFQSVAKLHEGLAAIAVLLKENSCSTTTQIAETAIARLSNLG